MVLRISTAPRLSCHGAGIDGGEVEDVVDDGEQRIGRDGDVAEIFALLLGQRPGDRIAQEMREADDVGERRAQLVRDVVHEIDLDLVGLFQRFVALAQRALDIDRIGDVLEGHQRGAVRQRHGGAIDHVAVAALDPAGDRLAIVDRGDRSRAGAARSGCRRAAAGTTAITVSMCGRSRKRCRRRAATCARRPGCTAAAGRRCRTPRPPR